MVRNYTFRDYPNSSRRRPYLELSTCRYREVSLQDLSHSQIVLHCAHREVLGIHPFLVPIYDGRGTYNGISCSRVHDIRGSSASGTLVPFDHVRLPPKDFVDQSFARPQPSSPPAKHTPRLTCGMIVTSILSVSISRIPVWIIYHIFRRRFITRYYGFSSCQRSPLLQLPPFSKHRFQGLFNCSDH